MSKFFTIFAFAFSFRPSIVLFRCVKRSCCYSYFCFDISISSHVVNLSRLLLRVLLDQVRSKNGKAFLYSATGHLTRYEPRVPCHLAHFQGHQQFHCKLQLTDKISQYIHSQFLLFLCTQVVILDQSILGPKIFFRIFKIPSLKSPLLAFRSSEVTADSKLLNSDSVSICDISCVTSVNDMS